MGSLLARATNKDTDLHEMNICLLFHSTRYRAIDAESHIGHFAVPAWTLVPHRRHSYMISGLSFPRTKSQSDAPIVYTESTGELFNITALIGMWKPSI